MASVDDIREVFLLPAPCAGSQVPTSRRSRHCPDLCRCPAKYAQRCGLRGRAIMDHRPRSRFILPHSVSDLLSLCIGIEAQDRTKVVKTVRGCAACGEIIREDGSIQEHGSGIPPLYAALFSY